VGVRPNAETKSRGGGGSPGGEVGMVPRQGGRLSRLADPESLPGWISDADIDFYVNEFTGLGFRGGLNWYRNTDRSWELLAPFAASRIKVPGLYIAGDRDLVVGYRRMDQIIASLATFVPQLRGTLMPPGGGHWTQQERAREVNNAMIGFLQGL
jgi:pimeloyl-ACP methyl ester carboxylesterase